MTKARIDSEGKVIDFTAGADYTAGDVLTIGEITGVVVRDVLTGKLGELQITGVGEFPREQATAFDAGKPAFWNPTATPEGGAATGAVVSTDGGGVYKKLGRTSAAAADLSTVTTVFVILEPSSVPAPAVDGGLSGLIVIRKTFADAAGDTSVFSSAGAPIALRVIDAEIENQAANGANANTLSVSKTAAGAAPITDLMALTGKVDTDIVRATKIAAANAGIAKGGALYLNAVKAGGVMGGVVTIYAVPA